MRKKRKEKKKRLRMCTPWLPPKSPLFDELSDSEWEYGEMEIVESP